MEEKTTSKQLLTVLLETVKISTNSLGFLLNCLLLRLVFKIQNKLHTTFSILITYTLINDIFLSTTVLMTVRRVVQCHETVAAVYYGPCTLVSGMFCRVFESIHLFSLQNWIVSQSLLIAFRIAMISTSMISIRKTLLCCLLGWTPGLVVLVWQLGYSYSQEHLVELLHRCTSEDFSKTTLSGFESFYNSPLPLAVSMLTVFNVPHYVLLFYFHRKQNQKLSQGKLSPATLRMHATLRKVSTAKAFLPLLLFIDVLMYIFCQMELLPMPFSEYFLGTISSSITILNPLIIISCFRPFQKKCRGCYNFVAAKFSTKFADGPSKSCSQDEEEVQL